MTSTKKAERPSRLARALLENASVDDLTLAMVRRHLGLR